MERDTHLQGILHISQRPHKNSSNKKAPGKKHPSMFPKSGAPMEAGTHFWALLNIFLGSPAKEPSFIHLSMSPVHNPPQVPGSPRLWRGPHGERCPASGDFNITSRVPSEGAPPQPEAPSTEPLQREKFYPQSPLLPSLKVPSRLALLQSPQMGPLWKEMPVSRAFSIYPSGSLAREPSLQVPFTELLQRETLHTSRAPFNRISKSLVDEPTPGCPTESPWREMPIPRASYIIFRACSKGAPLQVPLKELP